MSLFVAIIFVYLFGAGLIHAFCVNFISAVPLLDRHTFAIRNFLCVVWLIIVIIIFTMAELNNK